MLNKIISVILFLAILVGSVPLTTMAQSQKRQIVVETGSRPHGKVIYFFKSGTVPPPEFYDDQDKFGSAKIYGAVGGQIKVSFDPVVQDGLGGEYRKNLPSHQEIFTLEKPIEGALIMTKFGYWVYGTLPIKDTKGNPVEILRDKNNGAVLAVVNCGNPAWAELPKPTPVIQPTVERANLVLTKEVFNPNLVNPKFSPSTEAILNDPLTYRLTIENISSTPAMNVKLLDDLANLIADFELDVSAIKKPVGSKNNNTDKSLEIGTINPGPQNKVVVEYSGKVLKIVGTITNRAQVTADNADTKYSSAKVVVFQKEGPPTVTKLYKIRLVKSVRNVSDGDKQYTDFADAEEGETVGYEVIIYNEGNGDATNLEVFDDLSGGIGLNFDPKQNFTFANGITFDGQKFKIPLLRAGEQVKVEYVAKITAKGGEVINTAKAVSEDKKEVVDTAKVVIIKKGSKKKKVLVAGLIILGILVTVLLVTRGGGGKSEPPVKGSNGPPGRP